MVKMLKLTSGPANYGFNTVGSVYVRADQISNVVRIPTTPARQPDEIDDPERTRVTLVNGGQVNVVEMPDEVYAMMADETQPATPVTVEDRVLTL